MNPRSFLRTKKGRITLLTTLGCLGITGIVLVIIGVVKFLQNPEDCNKQDAVEAQKFLKLLNKVKDVYYASYPNNIAYDPDVEVAQIIDNFTPYDPTPSAIKSRTDTSAKLRKELKDLNLDLTKLKPREKKAVAQLAHYLDNNFGNPYEENYYAGDWMMGPNYFCWQPICDIGSDIRVHFGISKTKFVPRNVKDVENIMEILMKYRYTIEQYQRNMVAGVKVGMVRSVEDCKAGKNAFKIKFRQIVDNSSTGEFLFFL